MFADSLLDTPWTDRSRRGWTTLASFALQAAAAGVLLLLPLLYTQGLPQLQLMSALVAPTQLVAYVGVSVYCHVPAPGASVQVTVPAVTAHAPLMAVGEPVPALATKRDTP